MKKTLYLVIALSVLCVAPIYAQGAFTDVPSEHWAYDAVETLQSKGIVQGYPDGTYQGKRTMSRYELATVVARLLQQMTPPEGPNVSGFATKQELADGLAGIKVSAPTPPFDPSGLATKDDVAAIRKLVDAFKDELQSLGVDVDQVKRDLAALGARVDAIEAELRRVRFTGVLNVAAKTYADNTHPTDFRDYGAQLIDIDGRTMRPAAPSLAAGSALLRDIAVYRDFDLNVVGRVNETTTANATINFGNYINYLNMGGPAFASDAFTPYYMNIATDLGFGQLTVGRFPLQLSKYTFKMPVADSYVNLAKTTSGNRPVDGAMLKTGLLGLDWTLFAAQHDKVPSYAGYAPFTSSGPSNVWGVPFTQSAGLRVGFNAPANIRVNATYYQGWDKNMFQTGSVDTLDVMGADFVLPIPFVNGMELSGSWTQATPKADGKEILDSAGTDIDDVAWEGRLAVPLGGLKLGVGFRSIGKEFAAPGAWDKIAYFNNPVNVLGFNADLAYNFSDRLSANVGGQSLKLRNPGGITLGMGGFAKDDEINQYKAGVNYAFSGNDAIGLNAEWVVIDMKARAAGSDKPTISYVTLDWARKLGENADLKIGYQLIEMDSGVPSGTSSSFKGQVGVVQLGVSF